MVNPACINLCVILYCMSRQRIRADDILSFSATAAVLSEVFMSDYYSLIEFVIILTQYSGGTSNRILEQILGPQRSASTGRLAVQQRARIPLATGKVLNLSHDFWPHLRLSSTLR